MLKFLRPTFLLFTLVFVLLSANSINAAPRPQQHDQAVAPSGADLDTGAEGEKDDLQGSSSFGYGYYSSPYYGGYYGGYYPYYSGYYSVGYPYYGLYGYHGYHGHYF